MATLEELRNERLRKMDILKEKNINPFPAKIELKGHKIHVKEARARLNEIDTVSDEFEIDLEITEENKFKSENPGHHEDVILAGRIMTIRGSGKIMFVDISDETGKFQTVLKLDVLGKDKMELFSQVADMGDFFAFSGKLFITQRGEKSLEVSDFQVLTKSVLPMPSVWYGLENEEESIRKRYLDFAMNPEKRDLFYKKAKFWQVTREFLTNRGFLEVETPTVEVTTGGAEARPFKTYHNDFDMDVYMRICVGELWQKRLMAAGFEKTFEIGKAYRNEGSSPMHLQEFTNCEFYWAYADYRDGMNLIKDMYREIAIKVFGTTKFSVFGYDFDLADEWEEIEYVSEIKKRAGVDINSATDKELEEKLKELNVKYEGTNRERMTDSLWKYCRKQIAGPAFLVNHPTLVSPLSKRREDGVTTERFQPIFAGVEVGNGFSEQNDPLGQRKAFEEQAELIKNGDDEAMMPDWEFVEMLEHGMPPTFGWGFGERMFSILAGIPIREAQLFPLTKPKEEVNKDKTEKALFVILNKESDLEKWQELNTVGHLCAQFAGKTKDDLFFQNTIQTKDLIEIELNIKHPIIIKEISSNSGMQEIISEFKNAKHKVFSFTREMLQTNNDKKVRDITSGKDFSDVDFLGIAVFGEKPELESITKNLDLYK